MSGVWHISSAKLICAINIFASMYVLKMALPSGMFAIFYTLLQIIGIRKLK